MHLALWARAYGGPTHLQFHDLKLETVCRYLGIPIEAHDALHDVYATIDVARELSHRMGLTPQVVP
jgi:exonuclease I